MERELTPTVYKLATDKYGCFNSVHGHPLRRRWLQMWARCYDSWHPQYKNYGGRGIRVAEIYKDFLEYIKDKDIILENLKLEIDRIDNNGHYAPDNIRAATRSQQNSNRRTRAVSKYFGVEYVIRKYKLLKTGKTKIYKYITGTVCLDNKAQNGTIYLGTFKTEVEAARAYDAKVVEIGLERQLNFPENYPDYGKKKA